MGVIVAERTQPVEFFLSGSVPQAELNMGVVDVDVCDAASTRCPSGQDGIERTVNVVF